MSTIRVRSLNMDGTAVLEDGREVELVVARNGALGVKSMTNADIVDRGIDQSPMPDAAYFKTDIDQARP